MSVTQIVLPACTSADDYLPLFADCFPETLGTTLATREQYRWKYSLEGKARSCFEYGAYEDERMIGYYAALPFRYNISGRVSLGGMVCDVMTHSSMRGRGLFTQQGRFATADMQDAGVALCLGFPIRPYVIPGHLKVGWRVAFDLPVYFKLINPLPLLDTRNLGWLSGVVRVVSAVHRAGCRVLRRIDNGGRCVELPLPEFLDSPELASFLNAWNRQYSCSLIRTPDLLKWRLAAPGTSYIALGLYKKNVLSGVAILRIMTVQGISVLGIADLLTLAGAELSALHATIEALARSRGLAGIAIMCTRSNARRAALLRNAFVRSSVVFKLIIKWLSPEPASEQVWDESAWYLSWLDTDTI